MKKNILILTILTLLGCNANDTASIENHKVSNGVGEATITMYTLEDGTKCAVLVGYYKGAITCNWK